MFLKASCRSGSAGFYCQNVATRLFATQVEATKLESRTNLIQAKNYLEARPFSSIPGPSATSLLLSNLPGGRAYKADLRDVIKMYREEYGDILKFPSIFGNPALIVTHNPDHFQTVFRTEGVWPERLALESMQYFRQNVRPDLFGVWSGLINTQGKQWSDFRTAVNPVMIQPKNVKVYIPTIDEVASDFLNRIRQLRDPTSNRLPDHFEDELNKWALESIGVIAMDTRLGLISDKHDENATKFIESVKSFFALTFDLEFKPSIWRIVKTPKFHKLMAVLDTMTNLSSQYIDEAKARLEEKPVDDLGNHEKSVLEKLLKIDPVIAKVMAMDMVFAGVDTTSSAFTSVLYLLAKNTDKQEILRREIIAVLPHKTSSFTVEKMVRLPYLRACIKESQRLLPTLNGNVRAAGQDLVLDGYQIPKGTQIVMSSPAIQLEDKYYVNAKTFLPERWLKSEQKNASCPTATQKTHAFTYLPFGFGPRMCIGRRFAEMEIEILLSKLVRNFHVTWDNADLKFEWRTLNVPAGKLAFTLNDVEN